MTYMFVIRALVSHLKTVLRAVYKFLLMCFVAAIVYAVLTPLTSVAPDLLLYYLRAFVHGVYLVRTEPPVRRLLLRAIFTTIRAHMHLYCAAIFVYLAFCVYILFVIVLSIVLQSVGYVAYLIGAALFFSRLQQLMGFIGVILGFAYHFSLEYHRLLFADGDFSWANLVTYLRQEHFFL